MEKQETFSTPLPPEEIIKRVKKALRKGLDTHSWDDVRENLITGKMQMFWNDDGVCITEIVDTPQTRYLHVFTLAGQLPCLLDLEDQIIHFAKTQTCKFMVSNGRHGWEKIAKNMKWKKTHSVFVKQIEGF